MSRKPDLSAAFERAETDAARNADLLAKYQQRKDAAAPASQPAEKQPTPSPTPKVKVAKPTLAKPQPAATVEEEITVPLSTRVPKSLRQQLKRVSLQREEDRDHPWAIQHIVIEALSDWLKRNSQ